MGAIRLSFWFDELPFIELMGNRLSFWNDRLKVVSTPCLSSIELNAHIRHSSAGRLSADTVVARKFLFIELMGANRLSFWFDQFVVVRLRCLHSEFGGIATRPCPFSAEL
jgi:hypothetical protein